MTTDGDRAEYTVQTAGEDAPHCWICHEEGTSELGEPLRRDCSCRGSDSGFAHLSCLVEYAKHQTNQWDGHDLNKLEDIWLDCPYCKQRHQNELRVELATEFLSFVETNYSDDQWMHVTALYEKLLSLANMVNLDRCTLQTKQEAKDIANKILSLIKQVKAEESPLLKRDKYIEPFTYNCLGIIAMKEGTKDSFKEALAHFEKHRDLSILLGLTDEVIVAESNIVIAKEMCGEVVCIEKKIEISQKLYDSELKLYGEGAINTLISGKNITRDLLKADRLVEAESLLSDLATISKRVHGSNHEMTKSVVKFLHQVQTQRLHAQRQRNELLVTLTLVALILFLLLGLIYGDMLAVLYRQGDLG